MGNCTTVPVVYSAEGYRAKIDGVDLVEEKIEISKRGPFDEIHTCTWTSSTSNKDILPKALVICIHGVSDHGLKHYRLAKSLVEDNYIVVAIDLAYHGQTQLDNEPKGVIKDVDVLVDTAKLAIEKIKTKYINKYSNILTLGFGHSMGGAMCLNLLRADGNIFDGIVMSGPLIETGPAASSPFGIRSLYPVTKCYCILDPFVSCMGTLDPTGPVAPVAIDDIINCPYNQDMMKRDPYRGSTWLCNTTAKEGRKLQKFALEYIPKLNIPFIVLYGELDEICLPIGGTILMEKSATKSDHKRFEMLPGLKHDIICESGIGIDDGNGLSESIINGTKAITKTDDDNGKINDNNNEGSYESITRVVASLNNVLNWVTADASDPTTATTIDDVQLKGLDRLGSIHDEL